ncbi:hypothetical protein HV265_03610 [Citrobacter sp. RHBSTW-00678]|uniref:hypothetical protein n=1 Tax=Enterobacteriaceae TaxID=543 RepID=UPI0015E9AFA8|nr:hypothetical protein [Citrobacter sp. RHBSTW-00678]QLV86153.1 hypothetical protein HV265_03610 [Citrobacter sp. RHBSTW-00678]
MNETLDVFANIKFKQSDESIRAVLVVNDEEIPVSGKKGKWFTNIPMNNGDVFSLKANPDEVKLIFCKGKVYHPDQLAFDEKYGIEEYHSGKGNIYYSLSGETVEPSKILVTFPGVSNFDNINYRLSAMTSLQSRLKNVLIVAFQDKESVFGNYMFKTTSGDLIKPVVSEFINKLIEKYNINTSDVIFYGNSKGGSIAIDYIDIFRDSIFFIDIPQLELYDYDAQNALMRFSLGVDVRKHYSFSEYLPSIKNKNVTYSFAENDFDNTRGIPLKSYSGMNVAMLKDMEHSGSAMELVKRQFSKVIQLVTGQPAVVRNAIDVKLLLDGNKLYITRVLGSFDDEKKINKVYAEIEFFNETSSYSVSLNKRFDKLLVSYWKNGFDVQLHLPEGSFDLKLHIYYDYREFIYPINNRITLKNGDVEIF